MTSVIADGRGSLSATSLIREMTSVLINDGNPLQPRLVLVGIDAGRIGASSLAAGVFAGISSK